MKIGVYTVNNTNGNADCRDVVRVLDRYHEIIAEVYVTSRNPLGYIRRHPKSKYSKLLLQQLTNANVPDEIILQIMRSDV